MSSYQSNVLEHFKQSLLANTCSKSYLRKLWKLAVPFVDLSSCFPIRLTLIEVAPTFFLSLLSLQILGVMILPFLFLQNLFYCWKETTQNKQIHVLELRGIIRTLSDIYGDILLKSWRSTNIIHQIWRSSKSLGDSGVSLFSDWSAGVPWKSGGVPWNSCF